MRRPSSVLTVLAAGLVALFSASACERVPLLAPSGSVISLFATANSVPVNGQIEIVATVIESGTAQPPPSNGDGNGTGNGTGTGTGTTTTSTTGAGTPVHNGTLVTFTTTIGRIEPREARTNNGQVRVRFFADGQSGMATITAFSGGASGRIENLRVGIAAAAQVTVSASPQTLGPAGGTSEIAARVADANGAAVADVPVTFTATAGQLSAGIANTDQSGVARVTLTTTRESVVTARVGSGEGQSAEVTVGLSPRTGVSIAGPANSVSAGLPATFTIGVSAETNIRNVVVDYGDGAQDVLGALSGQTTVQHTYEDPGTFRVTATATEAGGFEESVSTSVTILPAQPPGVTLIASDPTPIVNQIITFTATVSGATSTIQEYRWDFGDGTSATTTGNQITKAYGSTGTKVIRVTVIQSIGPLGQGQTTVDVGTSSP